MPITRADYNLIPWLQSGDLVFETETLLEAGRATNVAPLTLVSRDVATGNIVPFSDAAAVDGTELPIGFTFDETHLAADIAAGKSVNFYKPGRMAVRLDAAYLVCEAGNILTTEIASQNMLIVDYLAKIGLITPVNSVKNDMNTENA